MFARPCQGQTLMVAQTLSLLESLDPLEAPGAATVVLFLTRSCTVSWCCQCTLEVARAQHKRKYNDIAQTSHMPMYCRPTWNLCQQSIGCSVLIVAMHPSIGL